MRILWHIFLIVVMGVSLATAGTVSCRDWKPGVTECNPYSGTFFKIKRVKRHSKSLRNKPITTRKLSVTQRIKVKNGITLDSLIRKYIKREERLYSKAQLKRVKKRQKKRIAKKQEIAKKQKPKEKQKPKQSPKSKKSEQKKESTSNASFVSKKTHPDKKSDKIAKPAITKITTKKPLDDRPQNRPPVVKEKEPRKLLVIEKVQKIQPISKNSIKKTEPVQTKIVELPKPIILTPIKRSDYNTTVSEDEREIIPQKKLEEETILPAELIADKNESSQEIKQSIKEEFAIYVVQKGDSLAGVAKRFGVDINNLIEINHLDRKNTLRVGQKLRIPLKQGDADAIATASYVVKRGDTLSKIAKHFHVKLKDIVKYNRIKKRSIIHIGQKLVLPLPHKLVELKRIEEKKRKIRLKKKRERERLARIALKKRQKAKFLRESKGLKRKLSVTATAYTSHRGQTDKTPFLAAWNNRIRPGMKIIAVSRDLITRYGITNGSRVRISGLKGIYTVRDKMNKKWRKKIDIYMGTSRWRALRWGKRRVTLYY